VIQCVGNALSDSGPGTGRHVPTAVLSRQTAGLRGRTLILNLPGKPKAIRETIDEVCCSARRRRCPQGATAHSSSEGDGCAEWMGALHAQSGSVYVPRNSIKSACDTQSCRCCTCTEPARVQTAAAAAAASAHVTSAASHCLAWGCMPEHCSGIMLSERPHLAVDALMQGVRRQAGMRAQVFASIPACIDLLEGPYIETNEGVVRAFRPSQLLRPAKA